MNFRFIDKEKMSSLKQNNAEVPKYDFNIIVIGEMNANVGHVHSGSKNVMGKRS